MRAPTPLIAAAATEARLIALPGIPLVKPGDDLAEMIAAALRAADERLQDGDVLVVAQKIVSKAEGRLVHLATVQPSAHAQELSLVCGKDPRLVELILRESTEVVRCRRNVLIVLHRLGFVTANAGIDLSNVEQADSQDSTALLLPEDPDASCATLRARLRSITGADVAVVMNDSHGRAFRNGTAGVAIGASGLAALVDRRGEPDLFGRLLQTTEVGLADEIAAAASMLMGQAREGRPVVLIRGLFFRRADGSAKELIRPKEQDLFLTAAPTPAANDRSVEQFIRSRRSIRHYSPQPVPEAVVEGILESAMCAPSAHNRQPWRFAVIYDAPTKRELALRMGERLRADRTADGDPAEVIAKDVERSYLRIANAPVVILVCLSMQEMDVYPDERRNACERQMAVQSTAMAAQNILLSAHAAKLGASTMCAPLFCPETVRAVLGLAPDWEPQMLITLGYPAGEPKPARRRSLSEAMRVVKLGS
ncbi:MAG TPA: coenzyme F420-0:L-glutamate ligase [Xanthobacteraceae bacterium]|nr:coenzyme F420-0:L-glutamate ligase [Xanthobacteraceae bacterium]